VDLQRRDPEPEETRDADDRRILRTSCQLSAIRYQRGNEQK
jgi:hypothetical protein